MSFSITLMIESSSSVLGAQGLCLHYHQHPSSLLCYHLLSKFSSVHWAMALQSFMWFLRNMNCGWRQLYQPRGCSPPHIEGDSAPSRSDQSQDKPATPFGKGTWGVHNHVVLHSFFTVNCGGFKSVWMIPGTHSVPMAYLIKSNYI